MAQFETIRSEPVLVRRVVRALVTYLILVVVAETVAAFVLCPISNSGSRARVKRDERAA